MSISIIIPTYNRARLIPQAIDSMLKQSFQQWELIIVDDGSTDDTGEVVGKFYDSRIRYFRMEHNKGAPSCRNHGLIQAKNNYVGFLDSDDTFHPDKLLKHWQLFILGEYDCTVSGCERHNHAKNKITMITNIEPKENVVIEFINKSIAWKTYPIWKKDFLINNDIRFDEKLKNSQDYQFNCYGILNKPAIGYIHESLAIKNEYDLTNDAFKIRKSSSLNSLKSHLISRYLVLQYAKMKQISSNELKQIRIYTRKHKLSCFYSAFKLSFFIFLKLLVFSFSLNNLGRRNS